MPRLQLLADGGIGGQTLRFIKDDKLHAFNVLDQLVFGFADNPGDRGIRPVFLQGTQNRQGMSNITQRGQAQHTDTFRWIG